jgi:DNA-binding response OmpR family regulator
MNFLVIDDNFLLLRTLEDYLHRMNHHCTTIVDPTEVESWMEKNSCDAVILDILMPKINGLEVISIIRKRFENLPILIFTGIGFDDLMMQRAREAGANGYLSKGLDPSDIYLALMRLVHQPARRQVAAPSFAEKPSSSAETGVPPYSPGCRAIKIENVGNFGLCLAKNPAGCPHASQVQGEVLCHHPDWKSFGT